MTIENASGPSVSIRPAASPDVASVIELLYLSPPCSWMRNLSTASLAAFVTYAIGASRSVLLLARLADECRPFGYVFAIPDPAAFWLGFALERPVIAQAIWYFRRRRAAERLTSEFSWSPAYRGNARIMGVYVRPEKRAVEISRMLYLALFERLKERGISLVEEHLGSDYPRSAGRFPSGFGWRLEACGCGGRKVSKTL